MNVDLKELLFYSIIAAIQAGDEILNIYNSDFTIERKQDKSPLTLADNISHEIINAILKKKFQDIPLLSEEGKDVPYEVRKGWEYYWLVDPLDGTKEFIKRNDEFTVNIALIRKNEPVLGVVYIPVTYILYYGMENLGSYKKINARKFFNEGGLVRENILEYLIKSSKRLPIYKNSDVNKIRIVISRSHLNKETEEYIKRLQSNYAKIEIIPSGSSIKICLVAEGSADIYPRFSPTMEWDTAAGHAIIRSAGGDIYNINVLNTLKYNKKDLTNFSFIATIKNMNQLKDLLLSKIHY